MLETKARVVFDLPCLNGSGGLSRRRFGSPYFTGDRAREHAAAGVFHRDPVLDRLLTATAQVDGLTLLDAGINVLE